MKVTVKALVFGIAIQLVLLGVLWVTPESVMSTAVGIIPAVLFLMIYVFYLIPAAWIQASFFGVGQIPVPLLVVTVAVLMLLYAFLISLGYSFLAQLRNLYRNRML